MNGQQLREARLREGWTQERAAERLAVTQAYLSMVERGHRVLPSVLVRKAVEILHASPTALPLREEGVGAPSDSDKLRSELAGLGYPGFAHVRGRVRRNPAEVLLNALNKSDLDTRVVEGLPWLAFTYADLDWDWAVQNAKLHDLQNRLGFVTTLASRLGASPSSRESSDEPRCRRLKEYAAVLDRSRLAKEDTLCHDSLTEAERKWLRVNRPAEAAHWNLLTDMKAENLPHGRP
ncbi:MAG TPA: helix-turn-helix transcriptional regulator [Candidatus Dormibacteraeota bacterium]|nr:helix-turn-helix transcriptional regulator [Candidatus Dormibacteraeota bacterium]